LLPWKGRIFSIAWQDLSDAENEPMVIVSDDEEDLIRTFLEIFEQGNFAEFVGFKSIFDYRYIFNKIMLYRFNSRKFADVKLRDIKQLMDQVKEEFVYFPDKKGKLDDYGKQLLGRGKLIDQKTLLKRYLAGDFSFVEKFQLNQIDVARDLYSLHRFSSAESLPATQTSHLDEQTSHEDPKIPETFTNPGEKQCKSCLAFNPMNLSECKICGDRI